MNHPRLAHRAPPATRRDFVCGMARGLLGLSTLPLLTRLAAAVPATSLLPGEIRLGPATARHVIYLYMAGGMSHLDTFDPKPGAETQGPTQAIRTAADDVLVSQHFPLLAEQMDKICVVNSLQSNQGAHAQGQYFMHTSYELRGTIRHPTMGAWLNHMAGPLNPTLPGHVEIAGGAYTASAGFLETQFMPLPIGDPDAGLTNATRADHVDEGTFNRRMQRLGEMNAAFAAEHAHESIDAYGDMYTQAVHLMESKDLAAFDLSAEPETLRDAYGRSTFGQGCLLARRLVEHGVRFIEVGSGGWDTHSDNFERMEELCPPVDRGLAVLLADLDARGLLDETLVVLTTEFGRSPQITVERNGRNHHPTAFSGLLAGGGVVGGRKFGATDSTGAVIIENPVTVPDFNATIAQALGLPLDHVVTSPSGRPFTLADKGRVVPGLFG